MKAMEDSIFTKIIKGEIPAHRIYEDATAIAFLDIHPVTVGHTLVVPKKQVEQLWDLSPEDYTALMVVTQKIARHLRETLVVPRVGVQVMGVDVAHAHIHLIPFVTVEEFYHRPDQSIEPDHEALAAVAKKLAF